MSGSVLGEHTVWQRLSSAKLRTSHRRLRITKRPGAVLAGDQTEIGERGVTLSGGQKQRLSFSRAIYSDRDLTLLDDPLSAVDAEDGHHISDQAICRLLRSKCRILATYQLHVLRQCSRVF